MVVEEVIERKVEVEQSNVGEIEKRIEEQNKKETVFKKSIVGKSNFDKRQLNRKIKERKNENEKKRVNK